MTSCIAQRKDGSVCGAPTLPGEDYCFGHAPSLSDARRAGQSLGGKHKSRTARVDRLMPATLRPVLDKLLGALDQTSAGTMDPRRAAALASLAGAVVRVYEVSELEQRLADLEEATDARAS